ncbi:MAG: class I SAM-dependent methyltransferase [Paracoccaceae bacterium]|nr:class I SAM-dependent methyltransferase [Paracoccaceae bacterium]
MTAQHSARRANRGGKLPQYTAIPESFAPYFDRLDYAAQRQRNLALVFKMRSLGLALRQDRGRDWEHVHTALRIQEDFGRGSSVLDVGGGGSLFCYELALSGYHVTVVDIDPHAVTAVQSNAAALGIADRLCALEIAPECGWDVKSGAFDAAVSISVFEGLMKRQRQSFFTEIHRALSPDGQLFLTFDFGAGARALGDPPVSIIDLQTEIIARSGLAAPDPLPTEPAPGSAPMIMVLPELEGTDFRIVRYHFGAVRLEKKQGLAPPATDAPCEIVAPGGAQSPQAMLKASSRVGGAHLAVAAHVCLEIVDEDSLKRIHWISDGESAEVATVSSRIPDVILTANEADLVQLLGTPSSFWGLYYADRMRMRGDVSMALRLFGEMPAVVRTVAVCMRTNP